MTEALGSYRVSRPVKVSQALPRCERIGLDACGTPATCDKPAGFVQTLGHGERYLCAACALEFEHAVSGGAHIRLIDPNLHPQPACPPPMCAPVGSDAYQAALADRGGAVKA